MRQTENSASLQVRLLGTVELTFAGQPVMDVAGKPLPAKLLKLLCYLAVRKQAASRSEILELLWAGRDPANVRNALKLLRSSTGAGQWLSETDAISVTATTDLDEFRQALRSRQYLEALSIWGTVSDEPDDHVMGGNAIPYQGDAAFADWLSELRAEAGADYQAALYGAVLQLESQGDYAEALDHARRLLAADPLHEESNYRVMQLNYHLGAYRDVLSHFDNLGRTLEAEGLPAVTPDLIALRDQAELALAVRKSRRLGHLKSLQARLRQFGTTFVGREREISQLSQLIRQPGARVTVHGAGGAGKSRLAAEVGQRAKDWFEDGVAFVALDGIARVQDGVLAIMRELGASPAQGGAGVEALLDYLGDQQLLLVLDNPDKGPETGELLDAIARAGNVSCLVTSRTRTGVAGEQLLLLQGLGHQAEHLHKPGDAPADEAAELFIQCARRFDADFRVTADDDEALARICAFVAGMPLFIEHLAAWIRVMSIQEIADELTTGTELFSAVISELPEHHQQLEQVLNHSWAMLPESARLPTAKLSVFRAGFTTQAAKQVAGAGLLELRAAVDAAFVHRASGDWFELHDVMREYLSSIIRPLAQEYAGVQERHFEHYRQFAQELRDGLSRGEQAAWLQRFTQNRLNLELAASWAGNAEPAHWINFISNLGTALVDYSYHTEALSHFEKVLSRQPEDSRSLVEILTKSAYVRLARHDPATATALLNQAQTIVQHLQDEEAELLYVFAAAAAALQQRQAGQAQQLLHRALELARHLAKNPTIETKILSNLALAHSYSGDSDSALLWYGRALDRARSTSHVATEGVVSGNMAIIHHQRGEYAMAHELYSASIRIKRKSGDRLGLLLSLSNLGSLLHGQGQTEPAVEAWQETFSLAEAAGNLTQKARSLGNLGRAAHTQGQASRARVLFQQALALHRQTQNQVGIVNTLSNLSLVEHSLPRKRALLGESLELGRLLQARRGFNIAGILQLTAEVAEAEANTGEALAQLSEAAELVLKDDNPEFLAQLASSVGCLASGLGDSETALQLLDAADDVYGKLGFVREPASQARVDSRRQLAQRDLAMKMSQSADSGQLPASLPEQIKRYLSRLNSEARAVQSA